jgi:hypothetical protein
MLHHKQNPALNENAQNNEANWEKENMKSDTLTKKGGPAE